MCINVERDFLASHVSPLKITTPVQTAATDAHASSSTKNVASSYNPYLAGSAAYLAGLIAVPFLALFHLHYFPIILLSLYNCASTSIAVSPSPFMVSEPLFSGR